MEAGLLPLPSGSPAGIGSKSSLFVPLNKLKLSMLGLQQKRLQSKLTRKDDY